MPPSRSEPIESTEPTDPIESSDPFDAIDRIESSDQSDRGTRTRFDPLTDEAAARWSARVPPGDQAFEQLRCG